MTPLEPGAALSPQLTFSSSAVIDDSGTGTSTAADSAVANILSRLASRVSRLASRGSLPPARLTWHWPWLQTRSRARLARLPQQ